MSHSDSALALVNNTVSALASFGISDGEPTKPTNLTLLQKPDEDDSSIIPGRFRDSQSGLTFTDMEFVPLSLTPGQTLFPDGTLGAKPLCRSDDGIFPVLNDDYVRQDGGLGCKRCSKNQWVKKNGKNIKPECNEGLRLLLAELSTGFVYRFNTKGMAISVLKDFKETLRKLVIRTKLPPYALTFKMSSVKVNGAKGKYFIPKILPTGQANPSDIATFHSIWEYFQKPYSREGEAGPIASDPVSSILEGHYEDA